MTTPTDPARPPSARRRVADPPAEGPRPLRSVGYRVPVVLDEEFGEALDDGTATWSAPPAEAARPPRWERRDEVPAVVPVVIPAVTDPAPVPVFEPAPPPHAESTAVAALPRSLYLTALRVRHLQPGVFSRVLLVEGVLAAAVILALADLASAWLILVLPLVVAALVKLHDLVQEGIERIHGSQPGSAGMQNSPGGSPGLR